MTAEWVDMTVPQDPEPRRLPLAEVSLELGCHFYPDEWACMDEKGYIPREHMERGRAEYSRLCEKLGAEVVSTCIFLDGYNGKLQKIISPSRAVELLQKCASEAGVPLHYVGSEGACAGDVAEAVLNRIISPPPLGSSGTHEPTSQRGWISNGLLGPDCSYENEAYDEYCSDIPHSISLAVQMFKDVPPRKKQPGWRWWACPYLAAVWQLGRLGLLPEDQISPIEQTIDEQTRWDDLPFVSRLDSEAPPFTAQSTLTILPKRYIQVVHAESLILDNIVLPSSVVGDRNLPPELSQLAEYVLEK